MAQLCMWQLVIGYNLRELEVREEMKQNLLSYSSQVEATDDDNDDDDDNHSDDDDNVQSSSGNDENK